MTRKNFNFSKFLPHLIAIIVFLIVSYAYFAPLLEGKRLDQHDYNTFLGGAKEIIDFRADTGKEALWTNRMFVGMPSYLISAKYNGNLFQHLDRALQIGPRPGSYIFLLLLGAYILFISLRINPWLSMIGAFAFAFSSYNFIIILAGHNTKVVAIAYVAPVIAGIITTLRGKRLLGIAITGIFLSLQIFAGHPQITYYTIFIVLAIGLSELIISIKDKQVKTLAISVTMLAFVVFFSVMSNYSKLATTMEYDAYSMRSQTELSIDEEDQTEGLPLSYATAWSYGIDETMTLLIPGFKGGSSSYELNEKSNTYLTLANLDKNFAGQFIKNTNMYWGNQSITSGPVYLGAIIIFLFFLGMFILDNKYKWWILGVSVLAIMLSWGKNFMPLTEFFMHNVPGYNKFRTVSMTLVIPQIVVPILSILALNEVIFGKISKEKLLKGLKLSVGITAGISLLYFLFPSLAGNFSSPNDLRIIESISGNNMQIRQTLTSSLIPALEADRLTMLRTDAFRSLILIVIAAGFIYLYKIKEIKMNLKLILGAFAILFIVDMWPVNKRFLSDDQFISQSKSEQPYTATPADQVILNSKGLNERVLNLSTSPFMDANTSYFHQSLGGYHGAKMRRYQDLINTRLMDEMSMFIGALQSQDMKIIDSTLQSLNVINMLNTKFIIINPSAAPFMNTAACGNAWLVDNFLLADNADQELALISNTNLKNTAVLDKKFSNKIGNNDYTTVESDAITLVKYEPNRLQYSSSTMKECLAIFSEIFYEKGWEASIDGEAVDHFRADYLLRGLELPSGEHEIIFEFKPKSYYQGEKISYASSIILILLVIGALFFEYRATGKKALPTEE